MGVPSHEMKLPTSLASAVSLRVKASVQCITWQARGRWRSGGKTMCAAICRLEVSALSRKPPVR